MAENKELQKNAEPQSMSSDVSTKTQKETQQPADQLKNAGKNQAAKANSKPVAKNQEESPAQDSLVASSQDETLDN